MIEEINVEKTGSGTADVGSGTTDVGSGTTDVGSGTTPIKCECNCTCACTDSSPTAALSNAAHGARFQNKVQS